MRLKSPIAGVLLACVGLVSTSSCVSDPILPSQSELFNREFIKQFGLIDSNQDWNNATRGKVTVKVNTPQQVKVTTTIGSHNYLLADYSDVSGSRTIEFDMPRGVKDITVSAAGKSIKTQVGGSADFGNLSRAFHPSSSESSYGKITISSTDKEQWRLYSVVDVQGYNRVLPEGGINLYKEGVEKDFVFRSVGPIIIYPVYWNTNRINTLGICYLENGEMQHIPIYSNYHSDTFDDSTNLLGRVNFREGDAKTHIIPDVFNSDVIKEILGSRVLNNGKTYSELQNNEDDFIALLNSILPREYIQILNGYGIENIKTVAKVNNQVINGSPISKDNRPYWSSGHVELRYLLNDATYDGEIKGVGGGNEVIINLPNGNNDITPALLSKGVIVDVPIGMRYGMYLERDDNTRFYSVADYNPDNKLVRDEEGNPIDYPTYIEPREGAFHAATWKGPKFGWTWLAFEDCKTSEDGKNIDLNDMVFIIENAQNDKNPPVEVEDPDDDPDEPTPAEPIKWLIACEDLGMLDDFDFNDVVFEVEHVSGQKTATIRPLASGGTLEVYLKRDNGDGTAWKSPEWHSLFNHDIKTPVNVGGATGTAQPLTIDVPEDFSITSSNDNSGYQSNMGGFHLEVTRTDGNIVGIEPPGNGTAPQMFLIYQSPDKKWRWPKERSHITWGYPNFNSWKDTGSFTIDPNGTNWWDTIDKEYHLVDR